jgi:hypothetical protein
VNFRRRHYLPLLILCFGFALRTISLDFQSFWIDEVHSFYFVDHPLQETIRLIINPQNNGPFYYLLLWFWRHLAGPSDFALRYFSVLFSVLTVAAMWALVRSSFDRRVAAMTATLLAISPFAIWYGQEAKMYAFHMFLAALTTLLLVRALRKGGWQHWLAYGVTINLLGYSHFFGGFTIAAQGIVTVITTLKKPKKLGSYLLTMVLVGLPYIPVVRYAMRLLPNFQMQDISKGFLPLHLMVQELVSEYTLQVSRIRVDRIHLMVIAVGSVVLLGLWEAWRRDWHRGVWVTGLLVLPTLIFYVISFWVPAFSAKYLSATFLIYMVTVALAIEALRRWWRPLALLGFVGAGLLTLWVNARIWTDPIYQRSDWRAAGTYLEKHIDGQDAIVTFAHYIDRAINRYYSGPVPVIRFESDAYNPEPFYQELEQQLGLHSLWLVLHQDQAMAPQNRLKEGAGALYPQITGIYPNNGQIAVLGYNVKWTWDALPDNAKPANVQFRNGLKLVGFRIDQTQLPPTETTLHPPSNWIHVTTYWQRQEVYERSDFSVIVRMIDNQGGVWGGELRRPPTVFHFDPPETWNTDAIVEAHYDVNLNPATPPGRYNLVIGIEENNGDGDVNSVLIDNGKATHLLAPIRITRR